MIVIVLEEVGLVLVWNRDKTKLRLKNLIGSVVQSFSVAPSHWTFMEKEIVKYFAKNFVFLLIPTRHLLPTPEKLNLLFLLITVVGNRLPWGPYSSHLT